MMNGARDPDGGASLVGVLVVVMILGLLGTLGLLAFSVLPSDPLGTSNLQGLEPVGGGPANGGAAPGAAPGRPVSPVASAVTAACMSNVQLLVQAAATKQATDGAFPATVAELVTGRWLSEAPTLRGYDMTMESVGDRPTGKILVNDQPAEQGCAAAPRPGR